MRLNFSALTAVFAIVWTVAAALTAAGNSIWAGYGGVFHVMLAAFYPGLAASGTPGDVVVIGLYALVNGAIFGFVSGRICYGLAEKAETTHAG